MARKRAEPGYAEGYADVEDAEYEDVEGAGAVTRLSPEASAALRRRMGLGEAGGEGAGNPLMNALRNPDGIKSLLNISEEQAAHVRSLLAGGGTALGVEALGKLLGTPIAGALGGLLGGILADKVFRPSRKTRGW